MEIPKKYMKNRSSHPIFAAIYCICYLLFNLYLVIHMLIFIGNKRISNCSVS